MEKISIICWNVMNVKNETTYEGRAPDTMKQQRNAGHPFRNKVFC